MTTHVKNAFRTFSSLGVFSYVPVCREWQCNQYLYLKHIVTAVQGDVKVVVHVPAIKCRCCQCQQSSASLGLRLSKLHPRPTQAYQQALYDLTCTRQCQDLVISMTRRAHEQVQPTV